MSCLNALLIHAELRNGIAPLEGVEVLFNGSSVLRHQNWTIGRGLNSGLGGGNDGGRINPRAEGYDVRYRNIWIFTPN